ncbi:hypothetical protein [Actinomadura atramentaria]|uniref:hypothetical protein n=1 Tax=Actinomadura atramentaria TaxID=1990 RepID=UPI0012F98DE3|nr:hypothetical protein [Actinomadura atramentaria]
MHDLAPDTWTSLSGEVFLVAASTAAISTLDQLAVRLDALGAEGHPLAGDALALLRAGRVVLHRLPADQADPGPALSTYADPHRLRRAAMAAQHHYLLHTTPDSDDVAPRGRRRTAQCARLIARLLADATGGVPADPCARVLVPDRPDHEAEDFTTADDWISIVLTRDPHTTGSKPTMSARTWGLARFGLPDLRTTGFRSREASTAADLLRGLAARSLHRYWSSQPEATPPPAPAEQSFDVTWVDRFYGRRPTPPWNLALQQSSAFDVPDVLDVRPLRSPLHLPLTVWWRHVAAPMLRPYTDSQLNTRWSFAPRPSDQPSDRPSDGLRRTTPTDSAPQLTDNPGGDDRRTCSCGYAWASEPGHDDDVESYAARNGSS